MAFNSPGKSPGLTSSPRGGQRSFISIISQVWQEGAHLV
eukprot:CAMPEP_0201647380 /NCGR_PEP_ID=MMETSP0493-20130528/35666_1 /ASSEMBLY_ACC=CAM_ASM_000838 /TAXON_ID=420259 /ORGANISM="Thalassiosira gravida, Strain GMp14c1" /LENGTH=38 /DNA_ID= /DNA_START= /DNA_END= /DNA_ORIENTATION=